MKLPNVTRYALTTQVSAAWLKCRSAWMSSSATFTIVESNTTINWPRQTTARAIHARRATGVWDASTTINRHRSRDDLRLHDDPLILLQFWLRWAPSMHRERWSSSLASRRWPFDAATRSNWE